MRKIYLISAICLLSLLQSCSDFLKETQTTALQDSCYATEQMLETNVHGIIQQFSGTWSFSGEPAEFFSIASGLTHWGGTSRLNKPKWDSTLNFTQYATTEVNNNFFEHIFKGIQTANVLIEALPKSPVKEDYKKEIEAEAVFYRAVLYFSAVRIWGDLPLRTSSATVGTSSNLPRTPYYKIYEQIVRDLEFAEKYMRTPERAREISPTIPRPDKYAATAYLSSVYVTIGSLLSSTSDNFWDESKEGRAPNFKALGILNSQDAYTKALACAEKLIPGTSTYEAGCRYELVRKFGDLFNYDPAYPGGTTEKGVKYDAWKNPEQILVLSYTNTSGAGGYMANRTLPQYPGGTQQMGEANGNNGRWRPNRWVFQKWCETYPGIQATVTFKSQTTTLYYTSSDPRLEASLYYGEIENCKTGSTRTIYPLKLDTSVGSQTQCETCLPYFKKYWSTTYNNNNGDAYFYLMRYAEVYLNAAEAAAALGAEDKACQYIEVLHKRARCSTKDGAASAQPKWNDKQFTGEALRVAIFWERIFELYGEGHEWNEVHRNGAGWIVKNICIPKNAFLNKPEQGLIIDAAATCVLYPSNFRYSTDIATIRKGLLASFPYNEILFNNGITTEDQNDFYVQ